MTYFDSRWRVQNSSDASGPNDVTTELWFDAQQSDNGDQIRCLTNFSNPLDPPVVDPTIEATNSPSYSFNWTAPTIEVHCKKVRDLVQ